jgi:hypothetical protein
MKALGGGVVPVRDDKYRKSNLRSRNEGFAGPATKVVDLKMYKA